MFPCACFENGIKRFEIDELIDLVFAREAGDKLSPYALTAAAGDCW
jgi:hypothetical protein